MISSIFSDTTVSSIDTWALIVATVCSLVYGIAIALVHKATSKYTKNFLITTALLPVLVEAVMLMVNGNLGTSIAIMGAFSLVRFRSLPGTSREILIVFFAMAVGLATGMGQVYFGAFLTIVGCLMIFILNKVKLFDTDNSEKELKISIPENLDYEEVFDDIFKEYTSICTLEKTKTTNMGSMFELTYKVVLKQNKEKEFIDKIRTRNGNLKISLSHRTDNADL